MSEPVTSPALPRPPPLKSAFDALTSAGLPSPPLSVSSDGLVDIDNDLCFDTISTPQSTVLVSPKTAHSVSPTASTTFAFDYSLATDFGCGPQDVQDIDLGFAAANAPAPSSAVEALSQHHLERYLHYKALAAQAQAQLSFSLLNGGSLMPTDDSHAELKNNMLALQQPQAAFPNQGLWNATLQFQQQQQQAQAQAQHQVLQHAHAQAQAHLQAHAAAAAQRTMSMVNYFVPPAQQQQVQPQPPSLWSRESGGTSTSGASPPFPSTPTYSAPIAVPSNLTEGEPELEEDELSDSKGSPDGIPNLHGGGRGYVPGKTPDDPKKRHKCHVCGRGFARAFNLKSHVSTHDPARPKPHMCPHPMCKRSFSRLHDLERHRQGIHSDGPLVDAKRQGVSPSIVRAQSRMRSRAESGGLI